MKNKLDFVKTDVPKPYQFGYDTWIDCCNCISIVRQQYKPEVSSVYTSIMLSSRHYDNHQEGIKLCIF